MERQPKIIQILMHGNTGNGREVFRTSDEVIWPPYCPSKYFGVKEKKAYES